MYISSARSSSKSPTCAQQRHEHGQHEGDELHGIGLGCKCLHQQHRTPIQYMPAPEQRWKTCHCHLLLNRGVLVTGLCKTFTVSALYS